MKRFWLAVVMVVACVQTANAESIYFDFSTGGVPVGSSSLAFTGNSTFLSPTLVATAQVDLGSNPYLTQSAGGLGVGHSLDLLSGPSQIDNSGLTERVQVTLANSGQYADFKLASITFASIEHFDNTGFFAFLNELLGDDDLNIINPNNALVSFDPDSSQYIYTFTPSIPFSVGGGFTVKPPGSGLQAGNDDFTLLGVTLTATEVPEPISMISWLVIGAAGVAVARRKRRSAVAIS